MKRVNWRSMAVRMNDAHDAGEPLWSRLTPDEVAAICTEPEDEVQEEQPEDEPGILVAHQAFGTGSVYVVTLPNGVLAAKSHGKARRRR